MKMRRILLVVMLIFGFFAEAVIVQADPPPWMQGSPLATSRLRLSGRTTLTIATGAVAASKSFHLIDTAGAAASDDLDTISGGSDGQVLVIGAAHTDRTVVVKNGTGNIVGADDVSLDSTSKGLILVYNSTLAKWVMQGGSAVAGSGDVATDTIWDAAGDLVIGTGANTGGKLTKGAEGTVLTAGAATVSWVAPTVYQTADAELSAMAGLTFADASIIQLTGAAAAATLTSGGNNYFLKSNSDNSALEFAALPVPTTVTVADTTDTTSYVGLFESATGDLLPKTDAGITYNAGTGSLTITGTMTAASHQSAKSENIAGSSSRYQAAGTATDHVGEIGPASMTANTSYLLRDAAAVPSSANMVLVADGSAAASGAGTPADPWIYTKTWVDLDNYLLVSNGADPADSGALRLSNNTAIAWEQSTPGTDIFIALDSSDILQVGQNAAAIYLGTSGTGNVTVTGDLTVTGADATLGTGMKITGGAGVATFTDLAGTSEALAIDLRTENTAKFTTSSAISQVDFGAMTLTTTGSLGGTANEVAGIYTADGAVIYGQNDQSATLTSSASLWTANNFGVTTQFKLPSSDAGPTAAAGYLRHDSTVAGLETGALAWHDGDETRYIVDLDVLPSDDTYVVAYNATDDKFYMKADATGAGGSGSVTTLKEATTQVGGADIVVIDFGAGFDLAEDPDTEVNITLDLTEYTGDIGAAAGEAGDIYLADSKIIKFGNDQDVTLTHVPDVGLTLNLDLTVTGADLTLGTGMKITGGAGVATFTDLAGTSEVLAIDLRTENTAKLTTSSGVTNIDAGALSLVTTGQITGRIAVVTDADGKTLSGTDIYGSMQIATGAGTWVIPDVDSAAGTGQSFCIYATAASEIVIDGNAEDKIRLGGTLGAAGGDITNNTAEAAGDFICLVLTDYATDVAHWTVLGKSGTWTVVP